MQSERRVASDSRVSRGGTAVLARDDASGPLSGAAPLPKPKTVFDRASQRGPVFVLAMSVER